MAVWRTILLAVLATCLCVTASAQQTGRRVALVIGNSAYAAQGTLANPGPDSRLVTEALRRIGFTVTAQSNLGKQGMERALRDFSRAADGAEVALVYFAGHGMEANGVNWLIPTDAALADERDLSFEAVTLDMVLSTVERTRGLRMVVLDACRNNPFARSMRRSANTRSTVTRGLANVEVTGTLVLYAARDGTVAQDGPSGGNSPFATAFARRIPEPGVDIRLLVSKVRDDVMAATGRVQEPFAYGSLPGVTMALVVSSEEVSPAPTRADPQMLEALHWQGALTANSVVAMEDYLSRYPQGRYSVQAREIMLRLRGAAAPTVSPTPSAGMPSLQTLRAQGGRWVNDRSAAAVAEQGRGFFLLLTDTAYFRAGSIVRGGAPEGSGRKLAMYASFMRQDVTEWFQWQQHKNGNDTNVAASNLTYLGDTWRDEWQDLARRAAREWGDTATHYCTEWTQRCVPK